VCLLVLFCSAFPSSSSSFSPLTTSLAACQWLCGISSQWFACPRHTPRCTCENTSTTTTSTWPLESLSARLSVCAKNRGSEILVFTLAWVFRIGVSCFD
jgi:hypothetical protein